MGCTKYVLRLQSLPVLASAKDRTCVVIVIVIDRWVH
jgi:hypothetical protein